MEPALPPRRIGRYRTKVALLNATIDLMHVVESECSDLEGLEREAWIFNNLWERIEAAVGDSLIHYLAESSEPDEHWCEIEIVDE